MRIGVISSSGGSVLDECLAVHGSRHTFLVATDRPCGTEEIAAKHGVPCRRFQGTTNDDFSRAARAWFESHGGVDFIILFYLRIATPTITAWVPTFNLHPSLLPAYTGFNAIARALKDRSRFLGATLHLATDAVDMGPILAQAAAPIDPTMDKPAAGKLSFLQKTYLALLLIESMERGAISTLLGAGQASMMARGTPSPYFSPALTSAAALTHLGALFQREGHGALLRAETL